MNETLRDENETYLEDGEPTNILVSTAPLSNSIEQMVRNTGMPAVIDQLNEKNQQEHAQQAQDYEASLNEEEGDSQYTNPEDQLNNPDNTTVQKQPRKKRTTNKSDKTLNDSSGFAVRQREDREREIRNAQIKEERFLEEIRLRDEEIQRKSEETKLLEENYKLQLAKIKNEENLSKVKDVLLDTKLIPIKREEDYQLEIDATALLNKLSNEEREIEDRYSQNVNQINSHIEASKPPEVDPRYAEVEQMLETELRQFSDRNDMNSEHYPEFLEKYPIFNAYSEEYDRELTEEAWNIRKNYNRHLRLTGKSGFIGQQEYYHILDDKIANHFSSSLDGQNSNNGVSNMDRDYTNRQFSNNQQQPEPKLSNYRNAQGQYIDEYGQIISQNRGNQQPQPQYNPPPQRNQDQNQDQITVIAAQSSHLGMGTRDGNNMPTSLAHHSLDDRERIYRTARSMTGMRTADNSREMTLPEREAFYEQYFSTNPL